jgi:hypothetical protein
MAALLIAETKIMDRMIRAKTRAEAFLFFILIFIFLELLKNQYPKVSSKSSFSGSYGLPLPYEYQLAG